MRRLFGCPDIVSLTEKFLMARNFYRIFTENNPVMGDSKTFGIPEAKELIKINVVNETNSHNQINASFIDISRIKWLVLLLWSSFYGTTPIVGKLRSNGLLSTCTQSNRQHTGETSKTMGINASLQILGWYVKGTGHG